MNDELARQIRIHVTDGLTARMDVDERNGLPRLAMADQRQLGRQLIHDALERHAKTLIENGDLVLSIDDEEELEKHVFDVVFGLGGLQRLLDDTLIENINANGCDV